MRHIVKSFDRDLSQLAAMVDRMGRQVQRLIEQVVQALANREPALAEDAGSQEHTVGAMRNAIHRYAVRLLALRTPFAGDLRQVVSALLISSDLERIAGHLKNIAERTVDVNKAEPVERTIELNQEQPAEPAAGVPRVGRLAQRMVADVMEACAEADPDKARAVRSRAGELQAVHADVFRELLAYLIFGMEDPRDMAACTHLLFIGKGMEQIGTLAADIAKAVIYHVEGDSPDEDLPEPGRSAASAIPAQTERGPAA